jgi:predicted nucleotidyltransferase
MYLENTFGRKIDLVTKNTNYLPENRQQIEEILQKEK